MTGQKRTTTPIHHDHLTTQAEKVKAQIREVSEEMTRPELDLPAVVRLYVRQRELEAYLSGLLYALGKPTSSARSDD
jgi:hypothetical protein